MNGVGALPLPLVGLTVVNSPLPGESGPVGVIQIKKDTIKIIKKRKKKDKKDKKKSKFCEKMRLIASSHPQSTSLYPYGYIRYYSVGRGLLRLHTFYIDQYGAGSHTKKHTRSQPIELYVSVLL